MTSSATHVSRKREKHATAPRGRWLRRPPSSASKGGTKQPINVRRQRRKFPDCHVLYTVRRKDVHGYIAVATWDIRVQAATILQPLNTHHVTNPQERTSDVSSRSQSLLAQNRMTQRPLRSTANQEGSGGLLCHTRRFLSWAGGGRSTHRCRCCARTVGPGRQRTVSTHRRIGMLIELLTACTFRMYEISPQPQPKQMEEYALPTIVLWLSTVSATYPPKIGLAEPYSTGMLSIKLSLIKNPRSC